jgi:hypothetical protein
MSDFLNILVDSAFIGITYDPSLPFYAQLSFGFHLENLISRKSMLGITTELVPNYIINMSIDLDKMEFLKMRQRDPLIRLPTVNVMIDPRLADYMHQLYPVYPIPPGWASTNFSPPLHPSWPLNRLGHPIGVL